MNGHALIVVRDLDLLTGLCELLAEEGMTITLVPRETDVQAALRSLGPAAADGVLLVDDGVDVERLAGTNLPVIVMEGAEQEQVDHVGARVGMPIDADELLSTLSQVLAAQAAKARLPRPDAAAGPC